MIGTRRNTIADHSDEDEAVEESPQKRKMSNDEEIVFLTIVPKRFNLIENKQTDKSLIKLPDVSLVKTCPTQSLHLLSFFFSWSAL